MMKKIFTIILMAVMAASCTFDDSMGSNRSDYSLAQFNTNLLACSANSVVAFLTTVDSINPDSILASDFDSTMVVTENYDYEAAHYGNICEISVLRTAEDSTWTFSSVSDASLDFVGTVKMEGRNSNRFPIFSVEYSGKYDEGNGYTADFRSIEPVLFYWTVRDIYNIYYNDVANMNWVLYRKGKVEMITYLNNKQLDTSIVTYDGENVIYSD